MAFQDLEDSREDGRLIVLYEFTFGSTIWRYANADQDIVAAGQTWKAAAISDDGVRQSGESAADALQINAPQWIGPSQVFMRAAPSQTISVRIKEKHEDSAEVVIRYSGEIAQVNYGKMPNSCQITCETLSATLAREGLRLGWQRACPYVVYDSLTCKVSKASYAHTARVVAISGFVIQVNSLAPAAGYFDNGFIEWTHPIRGVEYIPIEAHNGVNLWAYVSPGELYVGALLTIYPGCSNTPEDCQSKFSNYDNYGGEPHMPGKSPFDGDPVF